MVRKLGWMIASAVMAAMLLVPSAGYPADEPAAGEPTAEAASAPAAAEAPNGLVDDLNGFGMAYQRGNLYTESGTPAYYGNDANRAVRSTTSTGYVVYKTDYDITSFAVYSYFFTGVTVAPHRIYASADGTAFAEAAANVYTSGEPVSNWQLYAYEGQSLPAGTRYLKIEFAGEEKSWTPQLAKVVINRNTASVAASPETGVIGSEPMSVSLSTPSAGAAVYYRTNADPAFKPYVGPLSLTAFTKLDAYAQLDGMEPSPVRGYTFFSQADMQIDRYGQVIAASFASKVTNDGQLLNDVAADRAYYGNLRIPGAFDGVGGLAGSRKPLKLKATGFFSVQQVKGKPQLVTPQGNVYFSMGVNGITNNETYAKVTGTTDRQKIFEWVPDFNGPYNGAFIGSKDNFSYFMANKYRKAGEMPTFNQFFAEATDRIKKWGFNGIGAWTPSPQAQASGMPYTLVLPLNGMAKPAELKVFDIFADGAVQAIDAAFANTLPALKDDPNLIGYFVDNEYAYEKFISTVPRLKASTTGLKKRLVQMLQEKYGDVAALTPRGIRRSPASPI